MTTIPATEPEFILVARGVVEIADALLTRFGPDALPDAKGVGYCRSLVVAADGGTRGNAAVEAVLARITHDRAHVGSGPPHDANAAFVGTRLEVPQKTGRPGGRAK